MRPGVGRDGPRGASGAAIAPAADAALLAAAVAHLGHDGARLLVAWRGGAAGLRSDASSAGGGAAGLRGQLRGSASPRAHAPSFCADSTGAAAARSLAGTAAAAVVAAAAVAAAVGWAGAEGATAEAMETEEAEATEAGIGGHEVLAAGGGGATEDVAATSATTEEALAGSALLTLGLSERGNLEREGRRLGEAPPRRFVLSSACAAAGASCGTLVGRGWLGGTSQLTSSSRSYQATSSSSERPPSSTGKAARMPCSWRRSSESSGRDGAAKYGGRLSSSRNDVRIASANLSATRWVERLLSFTSPSHSSSTCDWTKRRGSGHADVAFRTAAGLPMRGGRESISAALFRQAPCRSAVRPRSARSRSNFWPRGDRQRT